MLLIGHSRIARRRVLPALACLPSWQLAAVASRSRPAQPDSRVPWLADYAQAISAGLADVAYVSLANADHARWAEACLEAGMHVIVDKPAFLSAAEARRLRDLAVARRRCLAEATVFPFHPHMDAMLSAFREANDVPARALAIFSIPPLAAEDFRYRADLGGGAINDLGPYAACASRVIFARRPLSVHCRVLARERGVDVAFSAAFAYDGGGALSGLFGFDTQYQNALRVAGSAVAVHLQPAFTLAAQQEPRVTVRRDDVEEQVPVRPADMFARFLGAFEQAVREGDLHRFSAPLVADAELLEALRNASED
jgi:predicted dehydrogenase